MFKLGARKGGGIHVVRAESKEAQGAPFSAMGLKSGLCLKRYREPLQGLERGCVTDMYSREIHTGSIGGSR